MYNNNLKFPSVETLSAYKRYKNKLTASEHNFYQAKLNENRDNISKSWKIINEILSKNDVPKRWQNKFYHNGEEITDGTEICNRFNSYFVNVGQSLANSIQNCNTNHTQYMRNPIYDSIFIEPTSNDEIRRIIAHLKTKKVLVGMALRQPYWNEFQMRLLKH